MLQPFKEVGILGLVDIVLMAVLIYAALVWFKRKKATFILTGILICGLVYLFAYQLNLILLTAVLQGFFAVILIALIVIFREELRDFFEEIAVWSIRRKGSKKELGELHPREVEIIVRTLWDSARERVGALVVLKGRRMLARHLEGGVVLNGVLSEAILKSIFDPHTPGHDGAILIEDGRIAQIGVYLPLSNNFKKLPGGGTRHAAALGLSEVSDALCLVVSEERGTVSIVRHGEISEVKDPGILAEILNHFFEEISPKSKKNIWKDFFKRNYREKGIALAMALILWIVLVLESKLVHRSFQIPVEYPALSSNLMVSDIEPKSVEVTFSGPRNAFHFVNEKNIRLSLKLFDVKEGIRTLPISEGNLTYPKDIVLEDIEPRLVKVKIVPVR